MKIGNVLINMDYYDSSLHYSDGDIEEEILKIVKTNTDYSYALEKTDNWAILYHLHKDRENILSWYPFTGKEDVLEIGAGCGALTGLLAQKCRSVMCNDISLRRSEINAYRNACFNNIEIRVGNFTDVRFDKQFDIITLIGVLEYSACYVAGDNPAVTMLQMVSSMLKPRGKVLLAIENKFGLKYWAGCREDHTGKFFEGLMGYPDTEGIITYSKRELQNIFLEAGFLKADFYYPLPDYKFAKTIYSDDRLPMVGELGNLRHNYDMDRMELFDEKTVYNQLIPEGMFDFFANSYLVVAGKQVQK